jgi:hypothetical protein
MLAPLFALLRKDRPWIVVFAVAGLMTALGAVLFADPVDLLLLDYATAEATFWTAFGGGLALGAFAGLFDELLGTRELLWQRPVAAKHVAAARIVAVALVLLAWQLAIPLVLLLWWPFAGTDVPFLALGSWWEHQAAVVVAWPCAMVTLFAATLPLGWLLRLLTGGASFYVGLLMVDRASRGPDGQDPDAYLFACFAVAAWFAGFALVSPERHNDPDRPLARTLPPVTRWAIVVVLGLASALVGTEWESQWVQGLHRSYPRPLQQGREIVLVTGTLSDRWQIVDREHRGTASAFVSATALSWPGGWPWLRTDNEFEQPHFLRRDRSAGRSWSGHALLLAPDGTAWIERRIDRNRRSFERIAVDGDVRLSRSARVASVRGSDAVVLVVEPGAAQVWRLDAGARRLVAVPMPAGDRALRTFSESLRRLRLDAATLRAFELAMAAEAERTPGKAGVRGTDSLPTEVVCVRGERGRYAWIGGGLQRYSNEPAELPVSPRTSPELDDPLVFRRSLPATAEHDGLVHDYEPRTFAERGAVALAMGCSTLRPTVLQVVAQFVSPSAAPGWLCDGLVVAGRRTWLVVLQVAVAALLAWRVRRWLQRHGAPAATWTWQVALFGLPAFLVFVYFESLRRVVAREVVRPAPPRITDLAAAAEAS